MAAASSCHIETAALVHTLVWSEPLKTAFLFSFPSSLVLFPTIYTQQLKLNFFTDADQSVCSLLLKIKTFDSFGSAGLFKTNESDHENRNGTFKLGPLCDMT